MTAIGVIGALFVVSLLLASPASFTQSDHKLMWVALAGFAALWPVSLIFLVGKTAGLWDGQSFSPAQNFVTLLTQLVGGPSLGWFIAMMCWTTAPTEHVVRAAPFACQHLEGVVLSMTTEGEALDARDVAKLTLPCPEVTSWPALADTSSSLECSSSTCKDLAAKLGGVDCTAYCTLVDQVLVLGACEGPGSEYACSGAPTCALVAGYNACSCAMGASLGSCGSAEEVWHNQSHLPDTGIAGYAIVAMMLMACCGMLLFCTDSSGEAPASGVPTAADQQVVVGAPEEAGDATC